MSIPRRICRRVPNSVPTGAAGWQLPQTFEIVTPTPPPQMPPGVLRDDLYLAYVHSQMNPQTWTKVGANRTASQYFWIVNPLNPPPSNKKCPPCVSRGNLFGVYPFPDESAHVCHIWCQSAQPFDSFNRPLNLWPPKTHKNVPWDIEGRIVFSLYPFPDESADVYQIWCQSVNPFGSFYRLFECLTP